MPKNRLNPNEPKFTDSLATIIVLVCIISAIAAGLNGEYLVSVLIAAIGFATKLATRRLEAPQNPKPKKPLP
jgi:hypothetical protein